MPIYEYRRRDGSTFEVIQKFSDDPLEVDPESGEPVERVYSAPAIHFKGSGFHNTDYSSSRRSKSGGGEGISGGSGDGGGSGSGADGGSGSGSGTEKGSGASTDSGSGGGAAKSDSKSGTGSGASSAGGGSPAKSAD